MGKKDIKILNAGFIKDLEDEVLKEIHESYHVGWGLISCQVFLGHEDSYIAVLLFEEE